MDLEGHMEPARALIKQNCKGLNSFATLHQQNEQNIQILHFSCDTRSSTHMQQNCVGRKKTQQNVSQLFSAMCQQLRHKAGFTSKVAVLFVRRAFFALHQAKGVGIKIKLKCALQLFGKGRKNHEKIFYIFPIGIRSN